ncbi:MAG TPA: ABC transporter substrate-binding protein [Holophagaceae bacterium]|nr:ABC transporter substrate-binding protein [Holophagaceae bacterium]
MRRLLLSLLAALLPVLGWAGAPAAPARRVVSQTAGSDELLLALAGPGQIAALSTLAWEPEYCADYREARKHPRLEGSDAEAVLRFHPDLVLMASYSRQETILQLRRAGVKVIVFDHFDTLDEVYANLRALGDALGARDRAEALIARCQVRVDALRRRLAGVTPVRVLAPSSYGFIAGRDTTFEDLCEHAGALNVAAEAGLQGHAPIPSEQVLTWKVDLLVLEGSDREAALAHVRQTAPFKFLPAAKAGRCVLLPSALLASVSHHRIEGYEWLARALHPERFHNP